MVTDGQTSTWVWSADHHQAGRVLETQQLWGQTVCTVWFPALERVTRLEASRLQPLSETGTLTSDAVAYLATAARLAAELTQDTLLAPLSATILPLPHQIGAVSRVIAGDRIRYLLADEVGLGKTIEAGLIMRELKLRGLVQRILVVVPKGLVPQWVAEMRERFGEVFRVVVPSESVSQLEPGVNLWHQTAQVICSLDSVKPIDGRRGWSREQTAEYNRQRFDDLVNAGWDLIIVDEAHRLGGSTDQVARYRLGQGLAEAAPYLLLLSATPHPGKPDAFLRLMSLLDADAFPDVDSLSKDRVWPYVVRTEKRRAVDVQGQPLFKPRSTQLWPVAWDLTRPEQRQLYEAVTEYVRVGYNQAVKEKKTYIGFLLILMQRLVTSSTRAIHATLERRLEALRLPEEQLSLFPAIGLEEWDELEGQEQIEAFVRTRLVALESERAEVDVLISLATRAEAAGLDPKAQALLEWIYRLQRELGEPELKILIFTEFVPTQEMLCDTLAAHGYIVSTLNGGMDLDERRNAMTAFAGPARFLISTDAGGEGLNLQFCHVVINYDIPWNPMRIEQRIGRVDRIGQAYPVRAINFVLSDTVEYRVQEVLETKLKIILEQFGIDKTADVLDSAQAVEWFDDLYVEALLNPDGLDAKVSATMQAVQTQAQAARATADMLAASDLPNPNEARQLVERPLPRWVERMTIAYLRAYGGQAEKNGAAWDLRWPVGDEMRQVVFTSREAEHMPAARHLTLEDQDVRRLTAHLPHFADGQPIPRVTLRGLPESVAGLWSLWQFELIGPTPGRSNYRLLPLFHSEDGRAFLPTARRIWEQLLINDVQIHDYARSDRAATLYRMAWQAIETAGKPIFDELAQVQQERMRRERDKGAYAFAARRRVIGRIGLPAVRQHRLAQLEQEEHALLESLEARSATLPELNLILLLEITGVAP